VTDDEIVLDMLSRLDRLSIPYRVVGSFASSVWGRPRATHDTDVLVAAGGTQAQALRQALDPEYYVPEKGFEDAVRRRGMVNAIHQKPVWKIDLIFLREEPFQRRQFERRVAVPFGGRVIKWPLRRTPSSPSSTGAAGASRSAIIVMRSEFSRCKRRPWIRRIFGSGRNDSELRIS